MVRCNSRKQLVRQLLMINQLSTTVNSEILLMSELKYKKGY